MMERWKRERQGKGGTVGGKVRGKENGGLGGIGGKGLRREEVKLGRA